MKYRWSLILLPLMALLFHAQAAETNSGSLSGFLHLTERGNPVKDASSSVIYIVGFSEAPPNTFARMRQKDQHFEPALLPIVVGQSVVFPNEDKISHNVFSPQPKGLLFDLGQTRGGETPAARKFSTTGLHEIYCNIHPEMAASVLVLPNGRFTQPSADGQFLIEGIPAGTWDVFAYDRNATTPTRAKVTIAVNSTSSIDLNLDRSRFDFSHKNAFGEDYSTAYPEKN